MSFTFLKAFKNTKNTLIGLSIITCIGYKSIKQSFAKSPETHLYTWGSGQYFQTGLGTNKATTVPKKLSFFDGVDIADIAANGQQSVALTTDGKLYSFGRGMDYRLGHGSESNEVAPRLIEAIANEKVTSISCGEKHFAAVTEKGELWTWGRGYSHQLGREMSKKPEKVPNVGKIKSVSCGKLHTLALSEDGKVYSCGEGRYAALGHGDRDPKETFTLIGALSDRKVVETAAGDDFSLFLTNDGKVFSCGASDFGQTALGQEERYYVTPKEVTSLSTQKIRSLCGKYFHALAFTAPHNKGSSSLFVWGNNKKGQLGLGDTASRSIPVELEKLGGEDCGSFEVVSADCGGSHTAVVVEEKGARKRRVFVMGNGRDGQLGRGDSMESVAAFRVSPVEITESIPCNPRKVALGSDHSVCLCADD